MARLLEALKEKGIGITEEVETELLKEFAEKKDVELKEVEVTELKGQIAKRDGDIAELKKSGGTELKKQLDELSEKYKQDTDSLTAKVDDAKLEGELKLALAQENTKDVALIAGLIDRSQLKLDKDGKLEGFKEQLEPLKKDKAFLFNEETKPGDEKPPTYEYKPGSAAVVAANEKVSLKEGITDALGL